MRAWAWEHFRWIFGTTGGVVLKCERRSFEFWVCVIVYLLGTQSSYPTCWQHWFCPDLYLLYNITILIWEAGVGGCQCQVSASSRISFFSYTPHNLHSYTLFPGFFYRVSGGDEFGKDFSTHISLRSWRLLPSVEWLHQLITDAEVCRPTGPLRPVRTGGWAFLHVMRSYPNWSQPKFRMHVVWQWPLHNTTQHNPFHETNFLLSWHRTIIHYHVLHQSTYNGWWNDKQVKTNFVILSCQSNCPSLRYTHTCTHAHIHTQIHTHTHTRTRIVPMLQIITSRWSSDGTSNFFFSSARHGKNTRVNVKQLVVKHPKLK